MKSLFLNSVVYEWKITSQKRAVQKAKKLSDVISIELDEDKAQILSESLKADMLCSNSWYNLAVLNQGPQNMCVTAQYYLWAAIIDNDDLEAWSGSTLCAFSCQEVFGLLPLIIETAYYYHRENYINAIYTAIESHKGADALVAVEKLFASIITKQDLNSKIPILRVINENGRFENVFAKPQGEEE